MYRRTSTTLLLILFVTVLASAQSWRLQCGANIGMSKLFHKMRFETTAMHNFYQSVAISHRPDDYTWKDFADDYGLRESFVQPRFGFTGNLTYRDLPFFLLGELSTSSSSYQKPTFALTLGVGKDFTHDWDDYFFSLYGGFKHVFFDQGFGSETLVNSIGNPEARKLIATFFDPEMALGQQSGNLLTARTGAGKFLTDSRTSLIGVELYGELDLTNETTREARMNVIGIQAYIRFYLFNPPEEDIKKI